MSVSLQEIEHLFSEIFDDADNLAFDANTTSKAIELHGLCNQKIIEIKNNINELEKQIVRIEQLKEASSHYANVIRKESTHFYK